MDSAFDSTWEKIHSSKEWGRYPSEPVIRFVARNFYNAEDRKKIKILDFGCGAGANTWYLAREGFDVYAFDGSESAVKKTRKYLDDELLDANLKICDGIEIEYDEGTFDAVIDNFCIYANRIGDIRKMYKNCYKILRQGGKLF